LEGLSWRHPSEALHIHAFPVWFASRALCPLSARVAGWRCPPPHRPPPRRAVAPWTCWQNPTPAPTTVTPALAGGHPPARVPPPCLPHHPASFYKKPDHETHGSPLESQIECRSTRRLPPPSFAVPLLPFQGTSDGTKLRIFVLQKTNNNPHTLDKTTISTPPPPGPSLPIVGRRAAGWPHSPSAEAPVRPWPGDGAAPRPPSLSSSLSLSLVHQPHVCRRTRDHRPPSASPLCTAKGRRELPSTPFPPTGPAAASRGGGGDAGGPGLGPRMDFPKILGLGPSWRSTQSVNSWVTGERTVVCVWGSRLRAWGLNAIRSEI